MGKVEEALQYFESGFNCSQSIFATYAPQFNVDRDTALRISAGFGGGIADLGQTCGAVNGALMLLGLKYGNVDPDDEIAKARKKERMAQFLEKFGAQHQTITCRELLGCDISTPDGLQYARDQKLFSNRCPVFVKTAAEALEELLG